MTASYSEISLDSQSDLSRSDVIENFDTNIISSSRPDCLSLKNHVEYQKKKTWDIKTYRKAIDYLQSEGTVTKDGNMVLFVTEDLENKIRLSSPISKKADFKDSLHCLTLKNATSLPYNQTLTTQMPTLNYNVLNELENEARKVATTVDSITENLAAILHSASMLTVGCLETYRNSVCKTCDTVDNNIKSMYQLMAKCEELSICMNIIYGMAEKIKDIKKMLDLFESVINT